MSLRGIDTSKANGMINIATAKANGLQFCMIRCGYGEDSVSQDDAQFLNTYNQCKQLKIPCGSYFYTCALTVADTESEKRHIKRILSGKSFEFSVFVDMEDADGYKARHGGIPDRQTNTNIIKSLCDFIKSLGFKTGYYCNKDWLDNHVFPNQLTQYDLWYSRPGLSKPDRNCAIWQDQIGETGGHFPGVHNNIMGTCDTNICYKDYIINNNTPVICDTYGSVNVAKGNDYTAKITCTNQPIVKVGTPCFNISLVSHNGNNYFYKFTPTGQIGQGAGVYINNKNMFVLNIVSPIYKSDTPSQLNVKQNKQYQFMITANAQPYFVCGSNSFKVIKTKVELNKYYFTVQAIGGIGNKCGFYINHEKQPSTIGTIIA